MGAVYAKKTRVPVERSRGEIERILRAHGAQQVASSWDVASRTGQVACRLKGYTLRWTVTTPGIHVTHALSAEQLKRKVADEEARRWRVLVILIKAKLDAIETGGAVIEAEFLANICLPNGKTVYDVAKPEIDRAMTSGKTPTLLLGSGG